ncbi:MAG: sugar phosphate isomerase/epimerase family protein [bacterium]
MKSDGSRLGFSSAWAVGKYKTGRELADILKGFELSGVELEYRITEDTLKEILPVIKKGDLTVLSLHNFFPRPPLSEGKDPNKRFFLSSPDPDIRKQAVEYTKKTIHWAGRLEVPAVVLHVGVTELSRKIRPMVQKAKKGKIKIKELQEYLQPFIREWRQKTGQYLDQVFFSLEELNREAEKEGIKLGVENRYYFQEIPSMDQVGMILDKFQGGNIYYWHDMGHAHVLETLGFAGHQELLERYSGRLLGIHIHDSLLIDDHRPPGMGEIDFRMVGQYLKEDTIKILEISEKAPEREIHKGIKYLAQNLFS